MTIALATPNGNRNPPVVATPTVFCHQCKWEDMQIENLVADLMQVEAVPPPDTVAANLIHRILAAAVEEGASRPVLVGGLQLDDAKLRHPLERLPAEMLLRLLVLAEAELGGADAIFRIAFAARPACFSDIGFISRYASDLGEVLETNVRNQFLRQNIFVARFDRSAASLIWDMSDSQAMRFAPALELAVGTYVRLCREIMRETEHLALVTFRHKPRFPQEFYHSILKCPVEFDAPATSIHLRRAALFHPAPKANPELLAQGRKNYNKCAEWMGRGQEWSARGYFYLSSELNKSPLKLPRMAAALGLSERTLRRRLDTEGRPFRDLLDEVRMDMCGLYQMEATRSLGEVALLLGYAELSAFSRAYRRWYGKPPRTGWAE